LILGVVRGSVPAISKLVTLGNIDPIIYAGSITLGGGLLLFCINTVMGQTIAPTSHMIKFSIIGGLIGIAFPHIIFFIGIKSVDVGIASAMISGIPILIYLLSIICRQEIFSLRRLIGVAFGFGGVALIAMGALTENMLLSAPFLGLALILLSTFFYATNVIYISIFLPTNILKIQAASWMMIFGSAPIWVYVLLGYDTGIIIENVTNSAFRYVLVHCVISGAAYWLSFQIIANHGPVIYSVAAYLMVVFGIIIGVLGFQENYTNADLSGVALILIGVLIVTLKSHQKLTDPKLEPPQT
jgi:drug/metabolite transporter (DMT)-like permease